jgi:FkbM family methyltransferase
MKKLIKNFKVAYLFLRMSKRLLIKIKRVSIKKIDYFFGLLKIIFYWKKINVKYFYMGGQEHIRILEKIKSYLPEKGYLVDVGANIGINSPCFYFYQKDWNGVAIEASPETFNTLYKNIKKHRLKIEPLNIAVSNKNSFINFYIDNDNKNSGLSSTFKSHVIGNSELEEERNFREVKVESKTLNNIWDNLGNPIVDLLKIDIEGLDAEVILSTDFSSLNPKIIMAETNKLFYKISENPEDSSIVWKEINNHLENFGYKLFAIIDNLDYRKKYSPKIGKVPLNAVWKKITY